MKEIKLKPCPFCGGQAVRLSMLDNPFSGTRYFGCKRCCVVSFAGMSEAKAVAAWNRRAGEEGR